MSRPCRPTTRSNDDDPLLDLPGFRIGKRGIEKAFDRRCAARRARAAWKSTPMAASSANWATIPATPGKDIYLTIDHELQQFAAQRLGNESAACVVMDVATGDVLALASTPGYDPNLVQCRHHAAAVARR